MDTLNPNFDFRLLGNINPSTYTGQQHLSQEEAVNTIIAPSLEDVKTKAFPIAVLPKPVQTIVEETNRCLAFPIDFISGAILFAGSIAIGNTTKVRVKNGWTESASLYMALIGRPGTNKSHPLSFAIAPLMRKDDQTYAAYEVERREYEAIAGMSKKEREQLGHMEPVRPALKKYIVSDATPEGLMYVHNHNKRGIGLFMDELAGWTKGFNRYHNGAEQEQWLSIFSNKPVIIDRKAGEPIRIAHPFVSVCGTLQTGILDELGKDNRAQNGFTDRILAVIPDGLKKEEWSDLELDQVHIDNWYSIIDNLLAIPFEIDELGQPMSAILRFSQEADPIIKNWQKANTRLCNESDNESLAGIYTKLETYCVRFSLILQMLYYACGEDNNKEIGKQATLGAIELAEYFRSTATKVYALVSNSNPLDKLPLNKRHFYEGLPEEVQTKDAVKIGESFKVPERTVKRFLMEEEFFSRSKQGVYHKLL